MNMLIKRRQLVMAALVVALGSAVFVNWYFTNSDDKISSETPTNEYVQNLGEAKYVNSDKSKSKEKTTETVATTQSTDYFTEIKLKRTKAHDESLENLKTLLKSASETDGSSDEISKAIDDLSKTIKLEADLEALVSAKLKCECVVMINEKNAEIVVEKGSLNEDAILQITDAVLNNSEIKSENIKISEA